MATGFAESAKAAVWFDAADVAGKRTGEMPGLLAGTLSPDSTFDPLSDILDTLRVDSATLGRLELGEPWGVKIDHLPFSTSWTVMEGSVWLMQADRAPVVFHAGDTFLLIRGISREPYVLASSPAVKPAQVTDFWDQAELDGFQPGDPSRRIQHVRWGGGGGVTRVATTAFTFNDCHLGPLISALPELMILRAQEAQGKGNLVFALLQAAMDGEDTYIPGFSSLAAQVAQLLLLLTVRRYAASVERDELGLLAGMGDTNISRALICIHHNPEDAWTVSALARAAGLSRSSFAERFLASVGQTPMQYVRTWRMHLAREALASGRVTVTALAHELGYQSEAAFRAAFRRSSGRPPRDFRRHAKTQRAEQLTETQGARWGINPG